MGNEGGPAQGYQYGQGEGHHHIHRRSDESQVSSHTSRRRQLTGRAGADDKETFQATMVDENDRTKLVGEMHDIEGWTKFDFPGRGDKYSSMKWVSHGRGADVP